MKNPLHPKRSVGIALLFTFALLTVARAAITPTEWQHRQAVAVTAAGLTKLTLPAATFDAAEPALSDVRLIDPNGQEVPYFLDGATPAAGFTRPPEAAVKSFGVSSVGNGTVLSIETGVAGAIDAIDLETSAPYFLKAAHVDISADNREWKSLGAAIPIFRQFGAEQLRIALRGQRAAFVRVTLDERTRPIAFTGARVLATPVQAPPPELAPLGARITRRDEFAGETVLTVALDGRRVPLAALVFQAKDPLFMRSVSVAIREVRDGAPTERTIGSGTIYRVALDGAETREHLELPLEFTPPTRELLVHVSNHDSPPLAIEGVQAKQHPVSLLFLPSAAGTYTLLSGNPQVSAPKYDVAAFASEMRGAGAKVVSCGELEAMPDYRPRESISKPPLPDVPLTGAPLDTKAWALHRPIKLARAGVQELELDPIALAYANNDYSDLRVLRDGNQIPYVLERTSLDRSLALEVTSAPDPKRPTVSRWKLALPETNFQLHRLLLTSTTPLFRRQLRVYEKPIENGAPYERLFADITWSRTPEPGVPETLSLPLGTRPRTTTVFVETDNGDNPPITVSAVQATYPVVRLIFKTAETDGFTLAVGNESARAPSYDLSLVAAKLLTSSRNVAQLATDTNPAKPRKSSGGLDGGPVFWIALGAVVIVLLVVVAKLLPKAPPAA